MERFNSDNIKIFVEQLNGEYRFYDSFLVVLHIFIQLRKAVVYASVSREIFPGDSSLQNVYSTSSSMGHSRSPAGQPGI